MVRVRHTGKGGGLAGASATIMKGKVQRRRLGSGFSTRCFVVMQILCLINIVSCFASTPGTSNSQSRIGLEMSGVEVKGSFFILCTITAYAISV